MIALRCDVISGFHCDVNEICVLGFYTA
jgi:hypothetical protein